MTSPKVEELDAWWGSCSIKSLLPGALGSLTASGFVFGIAGLLQRGGPEQIILLALLGLCWVGLLSFWSYRVFGFNYRLTTCRLFVEIGLRHRQVQAVHLAKISGVACKINPLERFLGIGRVCVGVQDGSQRQIILRGVPGPEQVAERIRELSEKARQR